MDITILVSTVGVGIAFLIDILKQYQKWVSWIMLRIERDSADGTWSNDEKEQSAVDLYNEEIKPIIPAQYWFLKLLPSKWINGWIRGMIKKVCKDVNKLPEQK